MHSDAIDTRTDEVEHVAGVVECKADSPTMEKAGQLLRALAAERDALRAEVAAVLAAKGELVVQLEEDLAAALSAKAELVEVLVFVERWASKPPGDYSLIDIDRLVAQTRERVRAAIAAHGGSDADH